MRGLAATFAAFGIWGLIPLYLHPLQTVSALEITAHRVVWCCLTALFALALRGELRQVRAAFADRAVRLRLASSALLIAFNWLGFVWAVTHGHVIEGSLGYFINPLVNVLLGVGLLGERLNRAQTLAVALAAGGVAYLTWLSGRLPWIALLLALSFGLYGLLRKVVSVESLVGLATETVLIAPLGAAYLLWSALRGDAAFGHSGPAITALLLFSGPLTALPLALFAYGARRIQYATVGLIQFVAPSVQLLLGVALYGEPFPFQRLVGFALIWSALAVYAADGVLRARAARVTARAC